MKPSLRSAALLLVVALVGVAATFERGIRVATMPDQLSEISGLAASRQQEGVLWVHNDSGAGPLVYAVNTRGKLLGTFRLKGAGSVDWEDMAIGPAPDGGSYLYLADIGDNNGRRSSVQVYRVKEPKVNLNNTDANPPVVILEHVDRYDIQYSIGPRDAEAFMVDPLTGDFYIVTKREWQNLLFHAKAPAPGSKLTLEPVGRFLFAGTTAGDISPDGMGVLLRRYASARNIFTPAETAASYWHRASAATSLVELLSQDAETLPLLPDAQGEAIAFAADERGFYTTSEHGSRQFGLERPAPLNFYPLAPEGQGADGTAANPN